MTDDPHKTFRNVEQQQKNAEDKEMVSCSVWLMSFALCWTLATVLMIWCFVSQGLLLDEQTGCLLKFSGELEDVSREDFHELFSGHGKIKWVNFTRGAKEVRKLLKQSTHSG